MRSSGAKRVDRQPSDMGSPFRTRIADIRQPIVFLARTKLPIKFGALDHQPVSVLFVIIVPEHANEEHLLILGAVAEMFASENFRSQLESATDSDTLHRLFCDWIGGK
jgi:PTS system nitrogen regulatory IIA component